MYYVIVQILISFEADKNGSEVAVCGGEIFILMSLKKRGRVLF